MNEAREVVANWMMLRGYATGHGDTIQDLLFEMEAQAKGRGGPPDPPPGEGDFQLLRAEIERLRAALTKIADPDISWGHMKKIARDALEQKEDGQ